jgi:folate-dependent phosphoribosylglycinamide formyltransferase PurN
VSATPQFLDAVGCALINIHHPFLPAFIGAAPYRRAKERGVKLGGATAHYVTENLDEGSIIERDVVRVDHRHSVDDLTRVVADVERAVLSRAMSWHCENRIIRYGKPNHRLRTQASLCNRHRRRVTSDSAAGTGPLPVNRWRLGHRHIATTILN